MLSGNATRHGKRLAGLAAVAAAVILGASSLGSAGPSAGAVSTNRALSTVVPEVKLQGVSLADAFEFLRDISGANLHVNWRALEAAGIGKDTPLNIRLRDVQMQKVLRTLLTEASPSVPLTYYASEGVIEVTTIELADQQMITRVYPIDDLLMEIPDFQGPDFNLSSGSGSGGSGSGGGSSRGGGGSSGGRSGGSGSSGGGSSLFGGSGGSGSSSKTAEKTTTKAERADALIAMVRETVRPEIWRENGGTASIRYYNGHMVVTAPRSVHEAIGGATE